MLDNTVTAKATFLYGPERGGKLAADLSALKDTYPLENRVPKGLTERDAIFITYPDQFTGQGKPPLQWLYDFADNYLGDCIPAIHILPFFPYTSDDGFSISDYRAIKPEHGDWADIRRLATRWRMMYDFVCNHVSASHDWFQSYLAGDPRYRDYFIEADPADPRLAQVFRPRTLPLLSCFETASGPRDLWTTFSPDQLDLNYSSPEVLLEVADTLMFYVSQGASLIRLDAVGFIWKKLGTACMHLPETHEVIKLLRLLLDEAAPGTILVTETNVPHKDNISYLGNGSDEAGMIYQFPLPPLVLHSFISGNAGYLSAWASGIAAPSETATYFNFLASHDGIGLTPVNGILPQKEIQRMIDVVAERGGRISYRDVPGGDAIPYEMNVSYLSALSPAGEASDVAARKLAAAHAIAMAMPGVPGIYAHSLVGSRNWEEGVETLGYNRAVNREKLDYAALAAELDTPGTLRRLAYDAIMHLLKTRSQEPCFHPNASMRVVTLRDEVFCAIRTATGDAGGASLVTLANVSGNPVTVELGREVAVGDKWRGLLGREKIAAIPNGLAVELEPYGIAWIKSE